MPDFLAKEARGMHNILVHDYDGVNIGIVTDKLPSPGFVCV
jgi:uncharacterized protein with HEPN domain